MRRTQEDAYQRASAAFNYIRTITDIKPLAGIVLGTGLGITAHQIDKKVEINYTDIPGFPHSTVESHEGKLIFGSICEKPVIAMQGRFHYYEGWSMEDITLPIRVMHLLGAKSLIITNASGAINNDFRKGRIMLIEDHINLLGDNPLIGYVKEDFGPRFADLSEPYSKRLISLLESIATGNGINIHKGVYAALSGPNLETRAEYRMLKIIGADVVGMSTVPEVIVAAQMGMETAGLSIMTDECDPDNLKPVSIGEIIEIASKAEPDLSILVRELVKKL